MARKEGDIPKQTGKRPFSIVVAELFLLIVMAIYFAKIVVLSSALLDAPPGGFFSWDLLFYLCEVFMLFVTADAMLGLSSRRPKGWKKAVRGSFLLLLFSIMGTFAGGMSAASKVTFDPIYVAPLVILVLVLMLMPKVRDYYVPPMEGRKPLMKWIGFAAASELYPEGRYRIAYPEQREQVMDADVQRRSFASRFSRR